MLYLDLMERFPAARRELKTIFANIHSIPQEKLPLYVQVSTETFNEINTLNIYECNRAVSEAYSKAIAGEEGCEPLPL